MNGLIRTSPARRGVTTWDPFSRFIDTDFLGPTSLMEGLFGDIWGGQRSFVPAVDVHELDEVYEVTAELPGLTKKDVNVTLENNVLTISGERRSEREDKEGTVRRTERVYGSFSRSFSLPRPVDGDNVKASFKDGILTLTVPKAAEARPRRIDIS